MLDRPNNSNILIVEPHPAQSVANRKRFQNEISDKLILSNQSQRKLAQNHHDNRSNSIYERFHAEGNSDFRFILRSFTRRCE